MHEISKQYEAQKILCNVDFHLEDGERVAIVGQNGSGKSSFAIEITEAALVIALWAYAKNHRLTYGLNS
jgi:ATPase subunit of ABC transporter with duplicated ATPase domains